MGDAVYEVHVRHHLLQKGAIRPKDLHKAAIGFVSAKAQAGIAHYFLQNEILTPAEERELMRGRNAKSGSVPKNTDATVYRYGTAFEALLGFVYLSEDETRLVELMNMAIEFCEGQQGGKS
ncbi:MAG: Mini-ribonuclease 3 [Bacilli bacterium]